MAKGAGSTRTSGSRNSRGLSSRWEANWNPSPVTGWSKNAYGQAVSPLKTSDLMMVNRLRDGLIQNNAEYNGITLGNSGGRVTVIGASSARTAQNFINDVQIAEKAQREVDQYMRRRDATPENVQAAREIVAKYEKRINKKLWV